MTNLGELRTVKALSIAGLTPNEVGQVLPRFEWVEPQSLLVETKYQRDLSARSITLIRRIVSNWDWKSMKPPICATDDDGRYLVIDGQHTAIAAASHPGLSRIPILVVPAGSIADRANAFVRHNSDRIAMTPMQVHAAALASGDDLAVAMDQACRKAGARILRNPPSGGGFKIGETVAVATIRTITERRGVNFMARVLRILVEAMRAPVTTPEITAITALLTEPEWKNTFEEGDLSLLVRSKPARDWQGHAEATVRKGLKMPMSRALAIAWWKALPKRRKAA